MATAAQVVKAALQRIIVQASEADIEPDMAQDAIFAMNNYMLALDAEGVTLGYTFVTNLGDDITIPTGALRGLIANLAVEVSPEFNGIVSPALQRAANDGEKVMRIIGQAVPTMRFPGNLPVGSGNEGDLRDRHFYPDEEALILAETTGCIALEATVLDEDCDPVVPTPFITVSGALSAFSSLWPAVSAEQSYVVSGGNLTDAIHIAAPIDFEISITSGSGFGGTLDISGAATRIFVRFVRGSGGTSAGDIVHTSPGAARVDQPVTGTATPLPVITLAGALSQFGSVAPAPSPEQQYNVSGTGLSADVIVVPPANFAVSLVSGGPFTSSLNITPVAQAVNATVFIRMEPPVAGIYGGNITHDSVGATQKLLSVTGIAS